MSHVVPSAYPFGVSGSSGGGGGSVNSVTAGNASITVGGSATDPTVALGDTIANRPTFNSGAATSPFRIGGASVDVLVTGLNADLLDGSSASAFALSSHTHAASDIVSGTLSLARGGTAADLSATGGTSKLVWQESAGAAFTVRVLASADLPDGGVTLAKMANLAQDQFIVRTTASTGVPETATVTAAARTVLDDTTVAAMVDTLGGAASTGTGGLVRATSPTLVTPALGTPASGTLTNCTGYPTGASDVTLSENVGMYLDESLSADGKWTGIVVSGTAGAALAFGEVCYLAVADSRWELADADAASTSGDVQLGICVLAAAADGSATKMLLFGTIRADAKFPTLTIGAPVHLSGTAGAVQVAAPTTTDSVTRRLGFALTADSFMFNPSPDYYTHT